jgi:gas vesicle structural protein
MPRGIAERKTTAVDVLDRVLDKGIVIDSEIHISVAGIRLLSVDARVLVASFETYLMYAEAFSARPRLGKRARRTGAIRTLTCARGCTFRRPFAGPPQTSDTVSCPYRAGIICVVRPAD